MRFLGTEFDQDIREVSTKSLAYIGDAVFELFCRMRFSFDNEEVRKHVNASAQARSFDIVKNFFEDDEKTVALRGRNLKTPRSKEPFYRKATALESVTGYLFLKGRTKRLTILLEKCVGSRLEQNVSSTRQFHKL